MSLLVCGLEEVHVCFCGLEEVDICLSAFMHHLVLCGIWKVDMHRACHVVQKGEIKLVNWLFGCGMASEFTDSKTISFEIILPVQCFNYTKRVSVFW